MLPPHTDIETRQLEHGGRSRTYELILPSGAAAGDAARPRPLVIVLHGGGGTARMARIATRFDALAPTVDCVVAFPEATRPDPARPASFLRNPPFWNVGLGQGRFGREAVDDVGFISALIDAVGAATPIDRRRVYVTGFSNGGSMALHAGVELSERIAAIAAVAGHLYLRERGPARPVPLLYMSGDADPMNPLDGGEFVSPWGRVERRSSVREMLAVWARWCGCDPRAAVVRDDDGVRVERFGPGPSGAEVLYYVIAGTGHVWPGGPSVLSERIVGPASDRIDATRVIWNFLAPWQCA